MRLSTLLSLSLLFVPFALSQATSTTAHSFSLESTTTQAVEPLKKGGGGGGGESCSNDPTRNHNTCQCLAGFVDPHNDKKECKCGDKKNAELEVKNNKATCVCTGTDQVYNTKTKKCECTEECEASYGKHGKLTCKQKHSSTSKHHNSTSSTHTAQPSGYWKRTERALLDEAVQKRDDLPGTVEMVLRCKAGEKACQSGNNWHCIDLSTCGGCPGEAIDCGSLPGVSEVKCEKGRCVIDSCRRGYTHEASTNVDAPSNTTCTSKHGDHWLIQQAAQGRMRRNVD